EALERLAARRPTAGVSDRFTLLEDIPNPPETAPAAGDSQEVFSRGSPFPSLDDIGDAPVEADPQTNASDSQEGM
ncbi:MAG: hypothetical protein GYA33_10545, partial [Thermogutta sp.]|nr:hypothetical protein [Thermogutta sp.]